MVDNINAEEFDRIFDRIVWIQVLKNQLSEIYKQPLLDFKFNEFMCLNTYKVIYSEQEYYILTHEYVLSNIL